MKLLSIFLLSALCLSAAPPARQARTGGDDNFIPHLAVGGSWSTTLTMLNLFPAPVAVEIRFYDDNGMPLPLPTDTQGTTPVYRVNLPEYGSHRVVMAGGTDTKVGWAEMMYDYNVSAVGISAIFRQKVAGRPDFEAVSPGTPDDQAQRFQFDETEGYMTGLAIANPTNKPVTVEFHLRDEAGKPMSENPVTMQLGSKSHATVVLQNHSELGPLVKGRRGVLDIQAADWTKLVVLGLRFSPTNSFTTVIPYAFHY